MACNEYPPLVTVIIPVRNEGPFIAKCLQSIFSANPVAGGVEVLVVDGMSNDGTREILGDWCRRENNLKLLDNPERTVPAAMNIGIRAAAGKIIVRMDAHTKYAPDYIKQCLAALEQTGADNVGGPARTESTGYIQSAICAAYHSWFSVGGARFHDISYEGNVDTVTYGCWRRDVFDRIGLFDEQLARNQDDEFNLRLTRAGGRIWQSPKIISWYEPRGSLSALFHQYAQYGYWKVRVIQKHRLPASFRHLVPGFYVFAMIVLALLAMLWPVAAWAWIGLFVSYAVCNVMASLLTARGNGMRLFPVLPVVFACYHFGYGFGFLRGICDFIILQRAPTVSFSRLTRSSVQRDHIA